MILETGWWLANERQITDHCSWGGKFRGRGKQVDYCKVINDLLNPPTPAANSWIIHWVMQSIDLCVLTSLSQSFTKNTKTINYCWKVSRFEEKLHLVLNITLHLPSKKWHTDFEDKCRNETKKFILRASLCPEPPVSNIYILE